MFFIQCYLGREVAEKVKLTGESQIGRALDHFNLASKISDTNFRTKKPYPKAQYRISDLETRILRHDNLNFIFFPT